VIRHSWAREAGRSPAVKNIDEKVGNFMDMENLQKAVDEYKRGERTLYQQGSILLNHGFTIFPIRNDEIELYMPEYPESIFRPVTPAEATEIVETLSAYCTNKEAIKAFLQRL
jgi:hypothetical protein